VNSLAFDVHIPCYQYGAIKALEEVQARIPSGSLLAIIGPNGGGKSTLLKLLAGLYKPTHGKISCSAPRHDIAYLPQANEIDRSFPIRAEDVVAMGMWPVIGPFNRLPSHLHPKINEILDQVGLNGLGKRSLQALSGGQLQRLFFARLIAQDASIILLDEPFAAVDPATTQDLLAILQTWHTRGKTIIAVLHDLTIVRRYFPETLLLAKRILSYGPTPQVLAVENLAKATFYV
jgi:zinc/manganese transport system ATP-binding protein